VSDLVSLVGRRDSDAKLSELTNEFLDSRVRAHSELFFSRASESLDSDERSRERERKWRCLGGGYIAMISSEVGRKEGR
jgi:hypothetical protein